MCWAGLHELPDGVEHSRSFIYPCRACGQLVTGGAAGRR